MIPTKFPDPLRDPGFLLWLGRFTGEWSTPRGPAHVERRPDGWLEAHPAAAYARASLATTLRTGTWLKEPPSPLGFYPVAVSASLMGLWLPPEEQRRLRFAYVSPHGMRRIVDALEQRIAEFPEPERSLRWLAWWDAQDERPVTPAERKTHLRLLARYREEAP